MALVACAPALAQDSWDLAKCRASAPAGHLCTPEHLETDLALLTARAIADFLDPEIREAEILRLRNPQMHIMNPEALPDPRTDPAHIQLLHAWAETGVLESDTAARLAAANQVGSRRESLRRATETVALKGIKNITVMIEDFDPRDDTCSPTDDALRLAATGPIIDRGIKVVSDDVLSPTFYVDLTTLSISTGGCAVYLSVTLRDLTHVEPGYPPAPEAVGSKLLEDESLFASPRSEFVERVTDHLRRMVDGFLAQVTSADQTR